MESSYLNKLNYGDLLTTITYLVNPKKIVEIGILNGYSLDCFNKNTSDKCSIYAYDIFYEFNGNHANKEELLKKFNNDKKINIEYGDFYKKFNEIDNYSIDILHIDIANNGDIYEFVIKNYMNKLTKNGVIIMEGGSSERDNIEWMIKYNKPKILPVINNYKSQYDIKTIGNIPSITLIKKLE